MAVTLGNVHQKEEKYEDDHKDGDNEPRPLDVKVWHGSIRRTAQAAWGV